MTTQSNAAKAIYAAQLDATHVSDALLSEAAGGRLVSKPRFDVPGHTLTMRADFPGLVEVTEGRRVNVGPDALLTFDRTERIRPEPGMVLMAVYEKGGGYAFGPLFVVDAGEGTWLPTDPSGMAYEAERFMTIGVVLGVHRGTSIHYDDRGLRFERHDSFRLSAIEGMEPGDSITLNLTIPTYIGGSEPEADGRYHSIAFRVVVDRQEEGGYYVVLYYATDNHPDTWGVYTLANGAFVDDAPHKAEDAKATAERYAALARSEIARFREEYAEETEALGITPEILKDQWRRRRDELAQAEGGE